MFFQTIPHQRPKPSLNHFGGDQKASESGQRLYHPQDPSEQHPEDSFRSSHQAEAQKSETPSGILERIKSLSLPSLPNLSELLGSSEPTVNPDSKRRTQKSVSFWQGIPPGTRIKQRRKELTPSAKPAEESASRARMPQPETARGLLEPIAESDSDDASSLLYKSTKNLATPLEEPPALPFPLGDSASLGLQPLHHTPGSSVLATGEPSGKSSRRATISSLSRPHLQADSSESEDESVRLTDPSDLDTEDEALYSLNNSSQESLFNMGRPSSNQFLEPPKVSFLTKALTTPLQHPAESQASSSRRKLIKQYRANEGQFQETLQKKARQKSEKLTRQLLKLTPGELGKNALGWQHKHLLLQDEMDRLMGKMGISSHMGVATLGINQASAELEEKKRNLTQQLEQLEEQFPFDIKTLSEAEFQAALAQYIQRYPEHALQLEGHMQGLYAQRQTVIEEQAKMDASEGRYNTLLIKAQRVQDKLRVYQRLREADMLERLSQLPQHEEERQDSRYYFEEKYTTSEIEHVMEQLKNDVLQSKQPNLMTPMSLQQKDQLLSAQLSDDNEERPADFSHRDEAQGLKHQNAKAQPERKPLTAEQLRQRQEQVAFLDSVARLQKIRRDNILTQLDRYINRYDNNSTEPTEKLSKFSLAQLVSARSALQKSPLHSSLQTERLDAAIKAKKEHE